VRRIKNGQKTLSPRFFAVTGIYGQASLEIVVSDLLVWAISYPLEQLFFRLYQNNEPKSGEEKGPNGEEVLVVEAGKELRALEVWIVDAQGQLVEDFKGKLTLTLAKDARNARNYRFKGGKAKISGINAAKKANNSYALDFHSPDLAQDGKPGPQLSIIMRTVPGMSLTTLCRHMSSFIYG
jgi:hypothetical protein